MEQARTNYLPTLDGWRTIAVLMVIGYHGTSPEAPWFTVFNYGHHGVNIFFGISGFLICSRLLDEEARFGRISLKRFYLRRAFRILPPAFLYILFINLMAALSYMTPPSSLESFASCFFFRNFLPPGVSTSYTGHYWSLAVEEHFYLLWPAFLLLVRSKRALWLTPLIALGFQAWRDIDFAYGLTHPEGLVVFQRTDRCMDGLIWGCALALLIHQPGWRERLRRLTVMPVWLVCFAALMAYWTIPLPYAVVAESMLIPLVLIGTVLHPQTPIGRLLESKPMAWFGRLSYSIYIWQSALFVGRYQEPADFQVWPSSAISLLAIAMMSYYFIEKPILAFGHRLTRREPPVALVTPPEQRAAGAG
ncbi:MAG TPA: acyltransferase [Blastocatellia bacterium]|nr:acyltransferase [Blastocatellia bacterium]